MNNLYAKLLSKAAEDVSMPLRFLVMQFIIEPVHLNYFLKDVCGVGLV